MACTTGVLSRYIRSKLSVNSPVQSKFLIRYYAKKYRNDDCRRAIVDIPPKVDPKCPLTCERKKPKKIGILHRIKLKVIEGGTNFGTPFRRLQIKKDPCDGETDQKKQSKDETLPEKKEEKKKGKLPAKLEQRPGLQVSILGADTAIGQYAALLLKQCPTIKILRLYDAVGAKSSECNRDLCSVAQDLQYIDTNCHVQAYTCANCQLEQSLANADIVLILESGSLNFRMSLDQRFFTQAPLVRKYAEAIATECPNAFIIVGASPIDCMVPLVAESLKESGWYNPRKLLGSTAVQEMRASTLAARILCLEPRYTRVPCIGGTEGQALVPLFSRAVDYFDFSMKNAQMLTEAVRSAAAAVDRNDGACAKAADLSEAHALSGLVAKVANALLCIDVPIISGFVETDPTAAAVSVVRYMAVDVSLNKKGICKRHELPRNLTDLELYSTQHSMEYLCDYHQMALQWYCQEINATSCNKIMRKDFLLRRQYEHFDECSDKLLNKLEENEPELATSPEEECVICVNAKATMQTSPCGHRVVCRRCFVKTIQMAVSQRLLPLRCVICRAKILRLRQAPRLVTSKSWQVSSSNGKAWSVPGSVSSYSVGAHSVPASASLYSVTSGESCLSGVSSVSSNSSSISSANGCSTKLCGGAKCGGACLGAVPRATSSAPPRARQPASNSLRRSQHHSMKARLQDYQVHSYTGGPAGGEPSGRLPPIREFQREFREGRRDSAAAASASTRIRCAQKIVTQLETSPQKNKQQIFRPLKPSNKDDPPKSRDHSKETEQKKENPKTKTKKDEKKKKDDENTKEDKTKNETSENKKHETAEKKKEEKLRLKAEKEAKKEAKLQAKEEERLAKLLAKEEEKQAKLLAKEEKKKAKKEAKLAAQAEKEKSK